MKSDFCLCGSQLLSSLDESTLHWAKNDNHWTIQHFLPICFNHHIPKEIGWKLCWTPIFAIFNHFSPSFFLAVCRSRPWRPARAVPPTHPMRPVVPRTWGMPPRTAPGRPCLGLSPLKGEDIGIFFPDVTYFTSDIPGNESISLSILVWCFSHIWWRHNGDQSLFQPCFSTEWWFWVDGSFSSSRGEVGWGPSPGSSIHGNDNGNYKGSSKMPIMGSQESHKTSKPSSPCEDRLLVKGACLTLPLNPMMNHPFSPWKKVFLEAEWDCSGTSQWSACLCPVQVRGPRILKRWSYFSIGTYLFYIHIYFYWHLGQSFRTGHYLGINLPVDSGSWLNRLDPYAFHQDGLRTFVKDTVCVLYYYYIQYIYIFSFNRWKFTYIYILHQILYII